MDDINGDAGKSDASDKPERPNPETGHSSQGVGSEQPKTIICDVAGGVIKDQEDQTSIKATQANAAIEASQQDILDRIKAGEKLMIFFTAIVALTTVAQFIQSGCNNAATSRQTDKIIAAAKIQACAATKNAASADRFATSANGINTKTGQAVEKFDKMASAAGSAAATAASSAKQSEENAKAVLEETKQAERAWLSVDTIATRDINAKADKVGLPGVDEEFVARIVFQNTGRTPAVNTRFRTMYDFAVGGTDGTIPKVDWSKELFTYTGVFSPGSNNVMRDVSFGGKLNQTNYDFILHDRLHAFAYGKILYCDVFNREHWTTWCFHLLSGGAWSLCRNNNEIDDEEKPTPCPVTEPR